MIFISLALILVGFVLMEIMSRRITKMELEMRKNMQNQEILNKKYKLSNFIKIKTFVNIFLIFQC